MPIALVEGPLFWFFADLRDRLETKRANRPPLVSWSCDTTRIRKVEVAPRDCMAQLGCWEGYRLRDSWEETRNGQRFCIIRLEPKARRRRCCDGCGRGVSSIHDRVERRVRDLPVFEIPVELVVPRLRLACR